MSWPIAVATAGFVSDSARTSRTKSVRSANIAREAARHLPQDLTGLPVALDHQHPAGAGRKLFR